MSSLLMFQIICFKLSGILFLYLWYLFYFFPFHNTAFALEQKLYGRMSTQQAYERAIKVNGQLLEAEPIIAQSASDSYLYARDVLKGRFPEGEAAIAKSASDSYLYARYILQERFPEGEPAVTKDAAYSYHYARDVLKGRLHEGEPTIAQSAKYSYLYVLFVLDVRPNNPQHFLKKLI